MPYEGPLPLRAQRSRELPPLRSGGGLGWGHSAITLPRMDDGDARLLGKPVRRIEDRALLTGTRAVCRRSAGGSAHAPRACHPLAARARASSAASTRAPALALGGVHAVITGEDVRQALRSVPGRGEGADSSMVARGRSACAMSASPSRWCVADNRYLAEDAADLVAIDYEPLPAVIDPLRRDRARRAAAPRGAGSNEISRPRISPMAIPIGAFAQADARVAADHALSAQFLHADGMLRRRRRVSSGRWQL